MLQRQTVIFDTGAKQHWLEDLCIIKFPFRN